jgi:ectoine hydroxylase-related dioxygenase (phytanoyl-CoA dioxygenase family)
LLTAEQRAQYERDGYLVFERLFEQEEMDRLLSRLEDLVAGRVAQPEGIHMQVEPAVQRGESAAQSPQNALRKVEGLVAHDPVFYAFATAPRLLDRVADLVGPDIKLFRDALMMKPAHHGSAKPYHQDSAYWSIDPPELVSCWTALDDATLENGCMRVIPGSHRWGTLEHQHLADYQVDENRLDRSGEVAVPLAAGGCLLFHSLLLHATSPNSSPRPRRAMINSYMSARARFTGPAERKPPFLLLRGREYAGAV